MAKTNFLFRHIPLTPLKQQFVAGGIIGLMVFFILLVFQPFGTYGFSMANKSLFLFGYGVIASLCYATFYTAGYLFFPRWFSSANWSIIKEAACLILVVLLLTLVSLLYHHQVIGNYKVDVMAFLNFLKYTVSIALVPFSVLYYQKWIQLKLVERTPIGNNETEKSAQLITFKSNNKNEPSVTLPENEIVFIKSEGNYIEVMHWNGANLQRHIIRNTLNNVLSVLPEQLFCKIHRSYVVNLNFAEIVLLNGSSYELCLAGFDQKLPVSRSMVKVLKQSIQDRG